ncbi:hypothetical protein [Desulfosporosinus sp. SB140]|uniref:hypothetical protein n=1 Tax=Desulfosporosinus paludis TaxID=3115649 RepID=UPI0038903436
MSDRGSLTQNQSFNFKIKLLEEPLDSLKSSLSESLVTFFAERDEQLLDLYLNEEYDCQRWLGAMMQVKCA